jgi:ubiquitin C-terminal hydrolase
MIKKYQKFNGSILKTNVKINYPHILDIKEYMSEYVDTDTKYELYSVIRHSGGVDGGHYYTYSKNMINGLWFLHDDGDVFNVDESEPLNCNGYILFYRLI